MGLISCPSCNKQVSDVANTCPSCGHPIKATTIEKTGKQWKTMKLLSVVAIIVGFIFVGNRAPEIGTLLIVGGFIALPIAFIGSWWHHG